MKKNPWLGIWTDCWAISLDIPAVIGLRALKIARGGDRGKAEARLMVSEKIDAAMALPGLVVSGGLGWTPAHAAARVLAHCAPKVRANRQRLAR